MDIGDANIDHRRHNLHSGADGFLVRPELRLGGLRLRRDGALVQNPAGGLSPPSAPAGSGFPATANDFQKAFEAMMCDAQPRLAT
jgi:hypothetical protein